MDATAPTSAAEELGDTQIGRYLGTLNRRPGSPEATIKMLNVLLDWDQRPRYPETQRLGLPAVKHGFLQRHVTRLTDGVV